MLSRYSCEASESWSTASVYEPLRPRRTPLHRGPRRGRPRRPRLPGATERRPCEGRTGPRGAGRRPRIPRARPRTAGRRRGCTGPPVRTPARRSGRCRGTATPPGRSSPRPRRCRRGALRGLPLDVAVVRVVAEGNTQDVHREEGALEPDGRERDAELLEHVFAPEGAHLGDGLALGDIRDHRRRRLADRAAAAVEAHILHDAVCDLELDGELVAAQRIHALGGHRRVVEMPRIAGILVVVEDVLAIEVVHLEEFYPHTGASRTSSGHHRAVIDRFVPSLGNVGANRISDTSALRGRISASGLSQARKTTCTVRPMGSSTSASGAIPTRSARPRPSSSLASPTIWSSRPMPGAAQPATLTVQTPGCSTVSDRRCQSRAPPPSTSASWTPRPPRVAGSGALRSTLCHAYVAGYASIRRV